MSVDLKIPQHIAIIMDGNGRWAQNRNLPRTAGHKKGLDAVKSSIQFCLEKKIKNVTLFAFGKENWKRPPQEVQGLFSLFLLALKKDIKALHKNKVRLRIIGDRAEFQPALIKAIEEAEALTCGNTDLQLNIAMNYSGRWDIENAVAKMQANLEHDFKKYLCLAGQSEPDLLIRTGAVNRISNFLVWDLIYAEFYFSSVLWPDFSAEEFEKALCFFSDQERRFGLTSEQLKDNH